jgi:hypothetical protein
MRLPCARRRRVAMRGIGKRFVYDWHNHGPCGHATRHRPWSMVVVTELPTERQAVRFEKYLESGSGRAFARREGRSCGLLSLAGILPFLRRRRWHDRSPVTSGADTVRLCTMQNEECSTHNGSSARRTVVRAGAAVDPAPRVFQRNPACAIDFAQSASAPRTRRPLDAEGVAANRTRPELPLDGPRHHLHSRTLGNG